MFRSERQVNADFSWRCQPWRSVSCDKQAVAKGKRVVQCCALSSKDLQDIKALLEPIEVKLSSLDINMKRLETAVALDRESTYRGEVEKARGRNWARSYTIDNLNQLINLASSKEEIDDVTSLINKIESVGLLVQQAVPAILDVTATAIARILKVTEPEVGYADEAYLQCFIRGHLSTIAAQNKALFAILQCLLQAANAFVVESTEMERLKSCDLYVIGLIDFYAAPDLYIEAISSADSLLDLAAAMPPPVLQVDCRGMVDVGNTQVTMEIGEMKMGRSGRMFGVDQLIRVLRILKETRDAWAPSNISYRLMGKLIVRDVSDASALRADIDARVKELTPSSDFEIKLMIL